METSKLPCCIGLWTSILTLFLIMAMVTREFSAVTFNCHGLKSGLPYVLSLCNKCDIVLPNEHWLQMSDINVMEKIFTDNGKWCHLVSSMEPIVEYNGRPFGGLGFLCKELSVTHYKPVLCQSDRILGLQININKKPVLNIIGVYLPYQLQCMLDECSSVAPTVIIGDLNTASRTRHPCQKLVYEKTFNRKSGVLYDFIKSNDMCVANL